MEYFFSNIAENLTLNKIKGFSYLEPHLELVNIASNSSQIHDRIKMVIIKICGTNFYTNKNYSKSQKNARNQSLNATKNKRSQS